MFQTFTGNSRRPRQVNLSGRNNNPFAAVQQRSTPQGSPAAVLQAQQERKARQQERERLQAAKIIQRRWKGYSTRRAIATELRTTWDFEEAKSRDARDPVSGSGLNAYPLSHLKLLLRFADPSRDSSDIPRICSYATFFLDFTEGYAAKQVTSSWTSPLARLTELVVSVLELINAGSPHGPESKHTLNLLMFLRRSIMLLPEHSAVFYRFFYSTLSKVLLLHHTDSQLLALLQDLFTVPLRSCKETRSAAYEGFCIGLLTTPRLHDHIDLDSLKIAVEGASLGSSLRSFIDQHDILWLVPSDRLPWLLAYYTRLYQASIKTKLPSQATKMDHIVIVSNLLSILADDIRAKQDMHNTGSSTVFPEYAYNEITALINQQTIADLLDRTDLGQPAFLEDDDTQTAAFSPRTSDASILASYILTLIQVFPRWSDEIRMWMYMGSATLQNNGRNGSIRLPAIKFFCRAVIETSVFQEIFSEPKKAISVLGQRQRQQLSESGRYRLENEWRVVLLFLELYTFVLKIMDDEEFISGGEVTDGYPSWTRRSALELSEVKSIIRFLKNLAFAMYWYVSEISDTGATVEQRTLKSYFSSANEAPLSTLPDSKTTVEPLVVRGILSSSISYMKGTVTGLLRMLYERE